MANESILSVKWKDSQKYLKHFSKQILNIRRRMKNVIFVSFVGFIKFSKNKAD